MASVIKAMADENKAFHTILGVCEIENRHVLEDLVARPEISEANYLSPALMMAKRLSDEMIITNPL